MTKAIISTGDMNMNTFLVSDEGKWHWHLTFITLQGDYFEKAESFSINRSKIKLLFAQM